MVPTEIRINAILIPNEKENYLNYALEHPIPCELPTIPKITSNNELINNLMKVKNII